MVFWALLFPTCRQGGYHYCQFTCTNWETFLKWLNGFPESSIKWEPGTKKPGFMMMTDSRCCMFSSCVNVGACQTVLWREKTQPNGLQESTPVLEWRAPALNVTHTKLNQDSLRLHLVFSNLWALTEWSQDRRKLSFFSLEKHDLYCGEMLDCVDTNLV